MSIGDSSINLTDLQMSFCWSSSLLTIHRWLQLKECRWKIQKRLREIASGLSWTICSHRVSELQLNLLPSLVWHCPDSGFTWLLLSTACKGSWGWLSCAQMQILGFQFLHWDEMNPTLLLLLSSLVTFKPFESFSSWFIYLAPHWLIPNLSAETTYIQVNKTNQGSFPDPEIKWNIFCPCSLIYLSHRVASALCLVERVPGLSEAIKENSCWYMPNPGRMLPITLHG